MINEKIFYKTPNRTANILEGKPWVKGELASFHFHTELEFLYIPTGSMRVKTDKEAKIANQGEIIFINSKISHSTEFLEDGSSQTLVQFRKPASFRNNLKYLSYFLEMNAVPLFIFKTDDPDYDELLSCILDMVEKNKEKTTTNDFYITSDIYRILAILHRKGIINIEDKFVDIKLMNRILPVFDYIDNHYDEQLTLEDISEKLSLNREYFCRLFKKITGVTIFDYLNFVRVCKAEELFSTEMNFSEISYKVGFSSLSYFNRTFKKYKQVSPSDYKKMYKNFFEAHNM